MRNTRSTLILCGLLLALGLALPTQPAQSQSAGPPLLSIRKTITTAQLLALNATPVSLIAAPGAGRMIVFEGATLYKAAGTAYAGIAAGEDIGIKYTGSSGLEVAACETTGFLDQTTAQVRYVRARTGALAAGTVSDIVPVANAALVAHMLVGEITTGDSDQKVRVFYRILPSTL